jgi:RNA polymerase sigma factor (sigma-70 family)
MMQTQTGSVLGHLRKLVAAEHTGQLSDRQLLERFRLHGEEAAFEALVRRHGPLVLGVCRRLLHNEHDAEDAFQATFWVLARKAASVGRQGSLGGWLYQVAYHAALKTRARAATREKHERQAGQRPAADPLAEVTGRELLAVLDEELQRLPERLRSPLVLCYLQGSTRDEAARQLGWSLATLKRRLEEGRESLRCRLARRGLTLPAALLVAGLAQGPTAAAVPPLLAAATVKKALPVAAGKAAAGALTDGLLKTLFASRVKTLACLLLTAAAALGVALAVYWLPAQRPAGAVPSPAPRVNGQARSKLPAVGAAQPNPQAQGRMAVSGQVLGANGKPLADVHVAVVGEAKWSGPSWNLSDQPDDVLATGKADGQGRFRLQVRGSSSQRFRNVFLLAEAKGHGLGWRKLNPDADRVEAEIKLLPEQPLRGRLVTLQGQPAVGVAVHVRSLGRSENGTFQGLFFWEPARKVPLWPAPVTTNAQGRFVIRGLSRQSDIGLQVRDDRFAPQDLNIDTGDKRPEVSQSLSPSQIIEGSVVCADTGKPMPRAPLTVASGDQQYGSSGVIGGRADDRGRFGVNPLAGKWFTVTAYPREGEPYLTLQKQFPWSKGAVKHEVKLALPRGVLVRGKVTETASGKPVAGASVQFYPRATNNRFAREDVVSGWWGIVVSGPDGNFQLPVLPGPSHLLVTGPTLDYVHEEIGENMIYTGKPGGTRYYADAVIKLDLAPKTQTHEVAVKLRRGVTVKGRLVGPDGKPVARGLMLCRLHISALSPFWRFPVEVRDGQFEVHGCDPAGSYPVFFLDAEHKRGAVVTVTGKQAGDRPVTVRLAPCGRATVRYVDPQGKPIANHRLYPRIVITPGLHRFDRNATKKGLLIADGGMLANIDRVNYWRGPVTDAQGRCTLPALIPGATYRLVEYDGDGYAEKKAFSVEAGKTLDLGDVTIKKPQ